MYVDPFLATRGYGESVASPSGFLSISTLGYSDPLVVTLFSVYDNSGKRIVPIERESTGPIVLIGNTGKYEFRVIAIHGNKILRNSIWSFCMLYDNTIKSISGPVTADEFGVAKATHLVDGSLYTDEGYVNVWATGIDETGYTNYITHRLLIKFQKEST